MSSNIFLQCVALGLEYLMQNKGNTLWTGSKRGKITSHCKWLGQTDNMCVALVGVETEVWLSMLNDSWKETCFVF